MASLIDLYKGSEYENGIDKNKDKTPLSNDGGKNIIANEKFVDQVRGGAVNTTKYSDTVNF
jgi:hypothetical protein